MKAASPRPKVRIFLADDHCVVRKGLIAMLTEEPDMEVVGESESRRRGWVPSTGTAFIDRMF